MNFKKPPTSQNNVQKDKIGGVTFLDSKTHYRETVIKMRLHSHKDKGMNELEYKPWTPTLIIMINCFLTDVPT